MVTVVSEEKLTIDLPERMPPAQLLGIQQELGVTTEIKHAHEAPHTAHIVLVLRCRPPVTSFSHFQMICSLCSRNDPFVSSIDCSVHGGRSQAAGPDEYCT